MTTYAVAATQQQIDKLAKTARELRKVASYGYPYYATRAAVYEAQIAELQAEIKAAA